MGEGHALFAFLHPIDGVVLFDHIHDSGQSGGGSQAIQVVIQVFEIHSAGFEQDFPPDLGHQGTVGTAAIAQGDREIFLDAYKTFLCVVYAAITQTVTVRAQIFADGVFICQLCAERQGTFRVCIVQTFAAVWT